MRPSEGPLLRAAGVARSFGALRALRGVDLEVACGETLVVAGPNGAGKSTLLRILAGLMRPSAGTITIAGRRVSGRDADSRRPVGLVSHQSFLYEDLTLAENLTFWARLYRVADPRGTAAAALAEAGLAERSSATPRALSRGMLQRAAIARALLHRPPLLLFDEPFTGLDAASAFRLREMLERHAAAGGGAVVVTHRLGEAWELATHVAILSAGEWTLRETRAGTLDAFVARSGGLADA